MNLTAAHNFTLRQLQYIVAVAEAASFRKAADQCNVSQPSLSSQIAQVENALGVKLFERDRKRVLLTTAGRELVARAREILISAHDLSDAARRFVDPFTGTLRIGVIPTVSPYLLPAITPRLRSKFERLRVSWVEDKTDALLQALERGTMDAAILALGAGMNDLEQEIIGRDEFVLASSKEHKLAGQSSPASRRHLNNENILLLDDGHCFRDQALEFCGAAGAKELEFRATSLSTLVQMVAGGAGVTLLPALCVGTETKRAALHIRKFTKPVPLRTLALVWRKRAPTEVVLKAVAATIKESIIIPKG
jgi:LysR family transcriptional regulator, hydrogen peroxide-inducible genes activator